MGKYKSEIRELSLEEALDVSDIEELKGEMEEWVSNMSGTALENTGKYQAADDAVGQLETPAGITFEDLWSYIPDDKRDAIQETKIKIAYDVPRSRKQSTSRAIRLSNAVSQVETALQWLMDNLVDANPDQDYSSLKDEIDTITGDLGESESVEFPTMFG